jgi:hypothetical protein
MYFRICYILPVPFWRIFRQVNIIAAFFKPPFTGRTCGIKEFHMITVLKWLFAAVGTALAWLITSYTVEYLRPYKRK